MNFNVTKISLDGKKLYTPICDEDTVNLIPFIDTVSTNSFVAARPPEAALDDNVCDTFFRPAVGFLLAEELVYTLNFTECVCITSLQINFLVQGSAIVGSSDISLQYFVSGAWQELASVDTLQASPAFSTSGECSDQWRLVFAAGSGFNSASPSICEIIPTGYTGSCGCEFDCVSSGNVLELLDGEFIVSPCSLKRREETDVAYSSRPLRHGGRIGTTTIQNTYLDATICLSTRCDSCLLDEAERRLDELFSIGTGADECCRFKRLEWTEECNGVEQSYYADVAIYQKPEILEDQEGSSTTRCFDVTFLVKDSKIFRGEQFCVEGLLEGDVGGFIVNHGSEEVSSCCADNNNCADTCNTCRCFENTNVITLDSCGLNHAVCPCINIKWNGEDSLLTTDPLYNPPTAQSRNLLNIGTADASSILQANNIRTPDTVIDGSNGTYWRSNGTDISDGAIYLYRTLPQDFIIYQWGIRWVNTQNQWRSNDFTVQYQDSLGLWQDISSNVDGSNNLAITVGTNGGPVLACAKNFRICFAQGSSSNGGPAVSEFRLVGKEKVCPKYEQGDVIGCGLTIGNITTCEYLKLRYDFCMTKRDQLCINSKTREVALNGVKSNHLIDTSCNSFPKLRAGENELIFADSTSYGIHGSQLDIKICADVTI